MRRLRVKLGAELMTVGVLTISLLGSLPARAQSARDSSSHYCRDAVYVELAGAGGLYSFNFDYRITREAGFRVGFTSWSDFTGLPVTANYLLNWHAHHLEIGIGVIIGLATLGGQSFVSGGQSTPQAIGTGTLGYRYQPDDGGFVFRIDYTPLLEPRLLYSWGGVSLGYAF